MPPNWQSNSYFTYYICFWLIAVHKMAQWLPSEIFCLRMSPYLQLRNLGIEVVRIKKIDWLNSKYPLQCFYHYRHLRPPFPSSLIIPWVPRLDTVSIELILIAWFEYYFVQTDFVLTWQCVFFSIVYSYTHC